MRHCILIIFVFILDVFAFKAHAQCISPFVTEYSERSTTGIKVQWFDINTDAQRYEIEHGKAGFTASGIPTIDQIIDKVYTFQDLSPNTAYEFFLRTVCFDGFSEWNGPFKFSTNLTNPASCGMSLALTDNNCPNGNRFYMEVNHSGTKLGQDVFLEEVKLLMLHDWPPDLKISLTSPSGVHLDLISNRGIGTDHFGNPDDTSCEGSLTLSQNACRSIQLTAPPLRGDYKPEDDLNLFHDGSDPNGIWTLHMCDRALGDIGELLYAELVFNQSDCRIPDTLYVQETDQSTASLTWSQNHQCDSLLISYQASDMSEVLQTKAVACVESEFTIDGLSANTEYELIVQSKCESLVISSDCPRIFTTKCEEISLSENFDGLNRCSTICGDPCEFNSIWQNTGEDDHEWIIHTGATPSIFTGPDTDLSLFGNYLYIESSSNSCMNGSLAVLESECIHILSNESGCDMQFSYLMRGNDVNKLELNISQNDGSSWRNLVTLEGDQGALWKTEAFSLAEFHGQLVRFQFKAYGAFGNLGDIAIDQIDFFGSRMPNPADIIYYEDKDGDGFGEDDVFLQTCSDIPPVGFTSQFGDCDDQNNMIYPSQIEIACNAIDDNCNGLLDDENPINYQVQFYQNESCLGALDAQVEIVVNGGTGPYQFHWNTGSTDSRLLNIGKGVYFCQIEDLNGCTINTEFIEINATEQINFGIESIFQPNCKGMNNGTINIQLSGGIEPYTFQWSEGSESQNLENIGVGDYQLTITDQEFCQYISDTISITPKNKIEIGLVWKQDPSCFSEKNGQILVSTLGAEAPVSYLWSTGDTTDLISGLSHGLYSLSVTDANGCLAEMNHIQLSNPELLEIKIDVTEDLVCFDDPNGLIEISVKGGTAPYSYHWNTGDFTDDIFNLQTGYYSVTVTDSESCQSVMDSIKILSPQAFSLGLLTVDPVDCKNSSNGSISIEAFGGTPPYHYFWDVANSPDSPSLHGLTTGIYQLNAVDQFGCKARLDGIQVESKDLPLIVDILILSQNLCEMDSIGELEATVQDGLVPFDFNWSAGEKHIKMSQNDTLTGLIPGMYNVTVTDGDGCVGVSANADLIFPEPIDFHVSQIFQVQCYGDNTGHIEIETTGGSGELKYLWNGGSSTKNLYNIPAGTYWVQITDENNCAFISQNIVVNQPEPITLETNSTVSTGGQADGTATVIPIGGQFPYFYQWDEQTGNQFEPTAIDLTPGTYWVTVSDAFGCSKDTFVVVDVINGSIELNLKQKIEIFPNPSSNSIFIQKTGKNVTIQQIKLISTQSRTIAIYNRPFADGDNIEIDVSKTPAGLYFLYFITSVGDIELSPVIISH
jgi:subtilisin-like proprotein convertase family protein